MAHVILPNFDYQPNDTSALKWDEAPPPPDNYRCVFDWGSRDLDKSYGGLVWAPQIRDFLFHKYGVFGTFRTPLLLDEAGFRKLCYLVVGNDDDLLNYANGKYDRQSFVATKFPKQYLPFAYYDDPLEWARNRFLLRGSPQQQRELWVSPRQQREDLDYREIENLLCTLQNASSKCSHQNEELLEDDLFIDQAGQLVKSNDQVRLVNCTETELNDTIGTVYYHEEPNHDYVVAVHLLSIRGRRTPWRISIHNLLKFIPNETNLPFLPPKPPKHVVDWSRMPPERKRKRQQTEEEAVKKVVGLSDLSTDVKQHIASYLPLFEVERNLRRACRDTFWNFKKPPPDNLEYDFVYFMVSHVRDNYHFGNKQWHGVAHTTNDALFAIWNHDWRSEKIHITLKFVKFHRNHSIVPLLQCSHFRLAEFDPLGCHYCGVQQASDVGLDESTILLVGRDDPDQIEDAGVVFRHCSDWTPREPRMLLQHIGIQMKGCRLCGNADVYACRCETTWGEGSVRQNIYFSPAWFENKDDFAFSAPSDSRDKTVIVFTGV